MWGCATRGGRPASRRRGESGIALVAALIVMALVAAIGLGLALTTGLEPLAAANDESAWASRFAAEAGIAVAAHELAEVADWNRVLGGQVVSALLEHGDVAVGLPDGSRTNLGGLTNLATCGRAGACTDASAFTANRPWGPNNPRWRLFGHARLDRLPAVSAGAPPIEVVVWVGDDPADVDGDPFHDSGAASAGGWAPGACVLAVRAEAFAPRFGHRTILATIARPAPGCGPGARLVSWRVLS